MRVGAGGAHQPAADADAEVDAVVEHRRGEAGAEAELVEPVEVVDVERGQPLGRAGERLERVAIDDHAQHEQRRVELVEIADGRLVELGGLEVGVARLQHRLEDRRGSRPGRP